MRQSSRFFAAVLVSLALAAALGGAAEEKGAARSEKLDVTYYFLPG